MRHRDSGGKKEVLEEHLAVILERSRQQERVIRNLDHLVKKQLISIKVLEREIVTMKLDEPVEEKAKEPPFEDGIRAKLWEILPYLETEVEKRKFSQKTNDDGYCFGDEVRSEIYIKGRYPFKPQRKPPCQFKGYVIAHTSKSVWIVNGNIFEKKELLTVHQKRNYNVRMIEAAAVRATNKS